MLWQAPACFGRAGTPPGVCPKFKNEPEKLFRINKSAKNEPKTNLNEPRTNPSSVRHETGKLFRISKPFIGGESTNSGGSGNNLLRFEIVEMDSSC